MVDIDTVVSLCKRRGFIFPSSEIYGGFANSWDYGPLGVELKNNIKSAWWKRFVHDRDDMIGIDAAILMNPRVWEASGHLESFSDPLVDCKSCRKRFRADHLASAKSIKPDLGKMKEAPDGKVSCPECGGELTKVRKFNLMFKTFIGPVEDEASIAYLRPETAQAMFVDFKQIMDSARIGFPFGIAQIGKAFRNEVTPGNFIFRTREFEMMEIEYFVHEKDWEKYFDVWLDELKKWIASLGIDLKKFIVCHDIPADELAHYSKKTIDIDFKFPFGQMELYGLAYRTDFDLKRHQELTGQDLTVTDSETGKKFIPHVIEPSLGIDRTILAMLVACYAEEQAPTATKGETDKRVVLKFPHALAPYKVAVLPLSKKENLCAYAKKIDEIIRPVFVTDYDETQSIGRRYRRQDEIGTPYCITVDFDSLEDHKVTIRDRDSMQQDRIAEDSIINYLKDKLHV